MTKDEKAKLMEIWDDLTDDEKEKFLNLPDNRKSAWLKYYLEDEAMAENAEQQRDKQKNIVCKSCKYAEKLWSGKKAADYTAGSCEKYEVKPMGVYFDGEKCPKYAK